jgi:hypothetical protein
VSLNTDLSKLDLLWTNPNGGADFPAQTVTVANLSNYDFIVFATQGASDGNENAAYVKTVISPYVNDKRVILGEYTSSASREVTFNGNNLQFAQGNPSNSNQIPLQVWGMHKHN